MPTAPMPIPKGMKNNFGAIYSGGVKHYGLDIPPIGNGPGQVIAPESGVVDAVWLNDNTPGFRGYGPTGILLRGDSGVWHLLAHLQAWNDPPDVGQRFDEGEEVGLIAVGLKPSRFWRSPHVHWEVRTSPNLAPADRDTKNLDPVAWLDGKREVIQVFEWYVWLAVGVCIHYALKSR